jgi:hypothetical protein
MAQGETKWRCVAVNRSSGESGQMTVLTLEKRLEGGAGCRVTHTLDGWRDFEVGDVFEKRGDIYMQTRKIMTVIGEVVLPAPLAGR